MNDVLEMVLLLNYVECMSVVIILLVKLSGFFILVMLNLIVIEFVFRFVGLKIIEVV